jgi:hypothetical protein
MEEGLKGSRGRGFEMQGEKFKDQGVRYKTKEFIKL